ncbi:MAG: nucleotidyltransferase family protein [Ignavibacteriota bacterium]|nr:MAG: nucleotidyltransferase [Chlorobiota bacterium]MBE7476223.1 nucleotidyltransferase family protein [Ignavibacteriales bacterium]MBL1124504.1 nucleotidyltransferase [Ignavibacteriota bacterium]MCE7858117.1 nucleotidyltransferase [Ignavibacteria bacterium CHB3]MCL4278214.1 nucleotidyltransferase family protein [Ignavibacteriaceae bacterium]MEB2297977.1 nucleotidyltransferase family protein [Ignavibacteria bacterium]
MDILNKHKNELKTFCESNRIRKLSLFGSYSKNTFNEESDLDLLVEFEANSIPGYLDLARMENELTALLGIKTDLRTADELSRYFRAQVVKEAIVHYAAK